MNVYKRSKGGYLAISQAFETASSFLAKLPQSATNVKLFGANNNGVHSYEAYYIAVFKSTTVIPSNKYGYNINFTGFVPNTSKYEAECLKLASICYRIAREDGRY
jgi:hypothetical protein